jgi:hypothetical protein
METTIFKSREALDVCIMPSYSNLPIVRTTAPLKPGQNISVGFSTEPDVTMYEFLKDYLDVRIAQIKKQKPE